MWIFQKFLGFVIWVMSFKIPAFLLFLWSCICKMNNQPRSAVFILWDSNIQVISAVLLRIFGITISSKVVVGIFSRESENSYWFLSEALRFQDLLTRGVRTFTITNNGHHWFREEVSRCDFAILYHSKKRGRLNITDVTDSLYDQELKDLSCVLGKKNVLVVADDLDSATSEDKRGMLNTQPLIQEKARDLILITEDQNKSRGETREKIREILSHIDSVTQPMVICKGSDNQGIAGLVSVFIRIGNLVLWQFYKLFNFVGQSRIMNDEAERQE